MPFLPMNHFSYPTLKLASHNRVNCKGYIVMKDWSWLPDLILPTSLPSDVLLRVVTLTSVFPCSCNPLHIIVHGLAKGARWPWKWNDIGCPSWRLLAKCKGIEWTLKSYNLGYLHAWLHSRGHFWYVSTSSNEAYCLPWIRIIYLLTSASIRILP